MKTFYFAALLAIAFTLGCNSQDTNKTREDAAKTAADLKQQTKEAVKEIKKGAEVARAQGKAIAEGAREGWNSDSKPVNLNAASSEQLTTLPGVDDATAGRIIAGRPYRSKSELTSKNIVSDDEYSKIQDHVTVK